MQEDFWNKTVFSGMEKEKLDFIKGFAKQKKPEKMNQAMPFLMAQLRQARQQNITFTQPEVAVICEILSQDLPPKEQEKVRQVLAMLQSRH